MQEVNDCASAFDEGAGQNRADDEKERGLDKEIAARFALKIIATNIQKRTRRTSGRTAGKTIQRENLIIALNQREAALRPNRKGMPVASAIRSLSDRFHCVVLLLNAANLALGFNFPQNLLKSTRCDRKCDTGSLR